MDGFLFQSRPIQDLIVKDMDKNKQRKLKSMSVEDKVNLLKKSGLLKGSCPEENVNAEA
jgi:hypothetical protein